MSVNKLLILNGSHSEIPLIQAGKKLGFHVITTGNAPQLIGHNYADEYHFADFSNMEEILELATKLNIDFICSSANDFGAVTAAYVAEKMGLPGHDSYETTLKLHHKDLFKKFALEHQIPTPYADSFRDVGSAIRKIGNKHFPLIIKPVDLTGGKGISKVYDEREYEHAIRVAFHSSRRKAIVVEEFIEGTQHSFVSFVLDGRVVFYFSDNEFSYLNPYLVSTSAAPATNIDLVVDMLIYNTEKIVQLLHLKDGIFHIQYLYNGTEARIIEITRRCSGDLYPYPVSYAAHINWAEWIVKAECGLDCSDFPPVKQTSYCGRHCIMSPHNGVLQNIRIDESIAENVCDSLFWWKKGDVIDNYLVQKLGIVCLSFDSMEEMLEKIAKINQLIRVSML